jgi:hypothetical protein
MWRVYYGDGSVYTSEDGSALEAPRVNVQVIAQEDPSMGWELLSEADYYYFEPETRNWYIADLFTVWDVLIRSRQPLIMFGRMVTEDEFREIVLRVLDDLPTPKTGWRRGEPSWVKGR